VGRLPLLHGSWAGRRHQADEPTAGRANEYCEEVSANAVHVGNQRSCVPPGVTACRFDSPLRSAHGAPGLVFASHRFSGRRVEQNGSYSHRWQAAGMDPGCPQRGRRVRTTTHDNEWTKNVPL
jgi:hypothetical protein